jgi:UDP-2,3-diacylglucosamine pyrophosphatase LpxH
MLVVISDLHLGDGTTAESIPASAFYLFAKRVRQDAHFASLRQGKYRPIEELDVLLLGDIIDPLHSTKWLFPLAGEEQYDIIDGVKLPRITEQGDQDYIRPWSDPSDPRFAKKLHEVTHAILDYNQDAMEIFRKLASGEFINFDAIAASGERDPNELNKTPLKVRFHYMVGNHDWYYHLKGPAFDQIRQEIIDTMGLSNQPTPFPFDLRKLDSNSAWEADQAPDIQKLFDDYKIFARHGDCFDTFNFDSKLGRDHATLGDVFTMEVCNRYPEQLKRTPNLNNDIVDNLRHITNVRPSLATPLWITGQIKKLANENKLLGIKEANLKKIWDNLSDNFLSLDFVKSKDENFKFDIVDAMQTAIKISKVVSFKTIDNMIFSMQNRKMSGDGKSFAEHALEEPAFLDNSARYIIYGHTHHHETIPLDFDENGGNQIYFNSGTWHTYFDLARKDPKEKKFIPYKALTYITFYKDNEHDERHFETWSGAYA